MINPLHLSTRTEQSALTPRNPPRRRRGARAAASRPAVPRAPMRVRRTRTSVDMMKRPSKIRARGAGGSRRFRFRRTAVRFCEVVSKGTRATRASPRQFRARSAYARTRHRRYVSRAVAPLVHSRLLARAAARNRGPARRAHSRARVTLRRFRFFTLAGFGAGSRVSLASAARSSDTLAARRRRGALSESHARAGLTARRARRPGDVARGLLLWLSRTTKNVSPEATTMAPVARVARGRIRRSNRHIAPARPRRTACSRATCVPASVSHLARARSSRR